jgi:hypothetical protein
VPKGILYVETRPATPEQAAEYHAWYNETHLQEMLALDAFVSARRFAPVGDDGPFVAIYEIEADDLAVTQSELAAAIRAGRVNNSSTVQADPPPVVRFLREITADVSQ